MDHLRELKFYPNFPCTLGMLYYYLPSLGAHFLLLHSWCLKLSLRKKWHQTYFLPFPVSSGGFERKTKRTIHIKGSLVHEFLRAVRHHHKWYLCYYKKPHTSLEHMRGDYNITAHMREVLIFVWDGRFFRLLSYSYLEDKAAFYTFKYEHLHL